MEKFYDENLDREKLKKEYLKANSRCKYKNAEELQNNINLYFECCNQYARPYTVSGLALFLGITTQTLRNYEKNFVDTEYSEIIQIAKQRIEEYAEKSLYDSRSSGGAKYVLENNFDWNTKNENTVIIKNLEDVL